MYIYNEKCFNNLNQNACYWLGYLYADGNLYINRKKHCYQVDLGSTDKETLLNFIQFLQTNNPIKCRLSKQITHKNFYYIKICNQNITNRLFQLGLIPKKSLTLKFPKNIPNQNIQHFIRGYF